MNQLRLRLESFVVFAGLLVISSASMAGPLPTLHEWGSPGNATGQFRLPLGLAVTSDAVYVADFDNQRVQKFDKSGKFLLEWGHAGTGAGELLGPTAVAVDARGDVYVTDLHNHRVQKFTSEGRFLQQWGSRGNGPGQFDGPYGVALDGTGNVFISDLGNNRIQEFSADGRHLASWGAPGSEPGQLRDPWGIAVDARGDVYVADHGNHRVQKFGGDGRYLSSWSASDIDPTGLAGPIAIAVRPSGAIYVTDLSGRRVQKLSPNGASLIQWDFASGGAAGFPHRALAVDAAGDLYTADAANHTIARHEDRTSDFRSGAARLPTTFLLAAARPNPSTGPSSLVFATPRSGRLLLEIYDVGGRRVRGVIDGYVEPGEHSITWDGRGDDGRPVAAGVYLARARFDSDQEHRALRQRIVMLR